MSDPSRDTVSRGSTTIGSLSSEAGRTDDCNCYCGAGLQGVVPRRGRFARAPLVRADSIAARLISFPDQPVQIRSSSLSFGSMWMVLLSWHATRLGPR